MAAHQNRRTGSQPYRRSDPTAGTQRVLLGLLNNSRDQLSGTGDGTVIYLQEQRGEEPSCVT